AARQRPPGPTLLVDWSGSMKLTDANVERILKKAPVCTLAVYSANRTEGVLRVLAQNGKRVRPADVRRPSGACNVIDGPALEWLAGQPGPRLWLSDGQVTGVQDRPGRENVRAVEQLCQEARITRVATVEEVCAFLAKWAASGRLFR